MALVRAQRPAHPVRRLGSLIREWGRIGNAGGQRKTLYFESLPDALIACDAFRTLKTRRGYAALPEQLDLPL